jgi:DNA-binding transcriptional regulator YdaS (Cro superfamily)
MNLRDYLKLAERGTAADIARAMGVHPVMVSQWASGQKFVPLERCPGIEAATRRAVMRWDLRPDDWHRMWPELIGADGAPDVPETATQPGALDEAA